MNREAPHIPTFGIALRYWLKLGCISFGGPAGQIAIMHKELVDKRRWISDAHFLHALNFCMLLPGPEAQQLATYLGWRLHGAKGGIAAGALFVLPSVFILFGLSWLYMAGGHLPWLAAIFHGLLAAVIAVVAEAVLRIGKKALKSPTLWCVAALSFMPSTSSTFPSSSSSSPPPCSATSAIAFIQNSSPLAKATARPRTPPQPSNSHLHRSQLVAQLRASRRFASRSGGCPSSPSPHGSAGAARRRSRASFSARPRSSPSAVPMPCCPMSRSRPSRPTAGSRILK
jgi:chromate transport protein ChrA